MAAPTDRFSPMRISTNDYPERDRVAIWREQIGRLVLRLDIEPLPDAPFHADLTVRPLPGLVSASAAIYGMREQRTTELIADGNDTIGLVVNLSSPFYGSQLGRDVELGDGDGFAMTSAERSSFVRPRVGKSMAFAVPFKSLAPLVNNLHDAVMRKIPCGSATLGLLLNYAGILGDEQALATPELQHLAVTHIIDLIALTMGATRDATVLAEGRGGQAARLRAIKLDIVKNLGRRDLSANILAARHHMTPRSLQRLFEADGVTFSAFVLNQRLAHAHRSLSAPHAADKKISAIALEAGFSDVSYFNRAFRQLYGASPSDIRAAAMKAWEGR
jgi:AraC-like DNA-binding protein